MRRILLAIGLIATTSAAVSIAIADEPIHQYTIHRDLSGVGGETIDIYKDGSNDWTVLSKLKEEVQHTRDQVAYIAKGFNQKLESRDARITELERKVAGMQKQITILHAKKADK